MHAPDPAAGAAHAALEFRKSFFDADISCFRFFARGNPTNPFVPREGSNVFPYRLGSSRRSNGPSQIRRHFVHAIILSNSSNL